VEWIHRNSESEGSAMKVAPLLLATVMATAGTAAFAQARDGSQAPDPTENRTLQRGDDGRTLGQKARDGMHRMGDATKRVFNRGKQEAREAKNEMKSDDARRGETRAMGAGPVRSEAAATEGDRRRRMDDAYANWKNQSGTR
jgi:hypothetical protein